MTVNGDGMLKMSELAEQSGVSAGTIKHYLREGLLPEPVRTSRNMAYYPPHFVERIKLIKRLQEDRFMPLKHIRAVMDDSPERAHALVELEDRILERAAEQRETERISAAEVKRRYDLPQKMLDRLAELGVLEPTSRGYDADDVKIIDAMARFRAGGYDEQLGFTVYETHALQGGAAAARRGGGARPVRATDGHRDPGGRRRDHRRGGRAATRAHRRDALQAAARRAAPAAAAALSAAAVVRSVSR